MERKTIGGFIAALRKAKGMTQKELAELVNVSDKTVSRWERDEGAPDLSVIPVIAEIFDVTCDELLRGEKRYNKEEAPSETVTQKGEKQRRRILSVTLSKYKTRSFVSIGVSAVGFLAALAGNFGFLRAYLGFLIGAVFYLGSAICQAILINNAFLSVSDGEIAAEETGEFKYAVIKLGELVFGIAFTLLGITLPLITFNVGAYAGLSAEDFLLYGFVFGMLFLVLYIVVCFIINYRLYLKGTYKIDGKKEEMYLLNRKLKKGCVLFFVIAAVFIGIIQFVVNGNWSMFYQSGTKFYDYESFVEFMEEDVPYTYSDSYYAIDNAAEPVEPPVYYDMDGNVITEEEALTEKLYDSEGNEVCSYVRRNNSVSGISYMPKEKSVLPITVTTYDDMRMSYQKLVGVNYIFVAVYGVLILVSFAVYFTKRKK